MLCGREGSVLAMHLIFDLLAALSAMGMTVLVLYAVAMIARGEHARTRT
jgi:hypothetical protein